MEGINSMATKFSDYMSEIEAEAQAESAEAMEELEIMRRHFSEQSSINIEQRKPIQAGRTIRVLQNTSWFGDEIPTIRIEEGEPEWKAAHERWLLGQNPTDSTDWSRGVFMQFKPIEYPEQEPEPIVESEPKPSFLMSAIHTVGWILFGIWFLIVSSIYSCIR